MDLIFFDLDGTLLNKASEISPFTRETLYLLRENNIAHTVATGRTMQSAKRVIGTHSSFELPHIYNNGVTVWDPKSNDLKLENLLNHEEVAVIVDCALASNVAPFVNTVETDQVNHSHLVFYGQPHHQVERDLIEHYFPRSDMQLQPLAALPPSHHVTNISMIGAASTIQAIYDHLSRFDTLVAYSGPAVEGDKFSWIDVHHKLANKGSAVESLKAELGASNVICFGDSDNDLSMFALANECYAPQNAKDAIKDLASEVIGHHHEDGIAHFLRQRFSL